MVAELRALAGRHILGELTWTTTLRRGALGERARCLKEIDVMLLEGLDDSGEIPAGARYVLRQLRRRIALEEHD